MKNLKRLTRKQKILVSSKGLHPGSYLLVMETETGLIVCDKSTGTWVRVLGLIRYGDSKYPKQDANTSTDAGASTGSDGGVG